MTTRILTAAKDLGSLYDLVIIGAGPAGLSAALEASAAGLQALVLDEQTAPGGQMYHGITHSSPELRRLLGVDYQHGLELVQAFLACGAVYAPRATVWSLVRADIGEPEETALEMGISLGGHAQVLKARQVILATGALERPMPVPGWTLPGVFTAGAGQIAMKISALVPSGRIVLAGSGPLLYMVAHQLLSAGARIEAVLDTTDSGQYLKALPHLPAFLRSPYLLKGLKLMLRLRLAVRFQQGIDGLEIRGDGKVERVRFRHRGSWRELPADTVMLHQGVVPSINLPHSAGCILEWNKLQRCFQPRLDSTGQSTIAGLTIAGDGATIGGALSAEISGRLAALGAMTALRRIDPAQAAERRLKLEKPRVRLLRGRRFLETLYRPMASFRVPVDDQTIVCRCEEITVGQIKAAIGLGVPGPNTLKAFLRPGMGPCQGRLCALAITEIMAAENHTNPARVGTFSLRTPVKPQSLVELATFPSTDEALVAITGQTSSAEE